MALAVTLTCLLSACASRGGGGPLRPKAGGALTLDAPGVAVDGSILFVAAQLRNPDAKAPVQATVDSVELESASFLTDTPIDVGEIPPAGSAVVQASFKSGSLAPGKEYRLTVRGSLRDAAGLTRAFTAATVVLLPPASPGSARAKTVTVKPNKTSGAPYPPQRPSFDEHEANGSRWTVPTGPFVPGEPTRTQTQIEKVVLGDPPAIVFNVNNGTGITTSITIAEPSGGANGGNVVFVTSNFFAAYATDGGTVFNPLNPTTIFPADAIGFCCDQVVQYVPSIDRFLWLLQGNNGMRLASARPADIAASGGTAWTYWNLPSTLFGQPTGTGLDYPDLSVGNNSLYLSWDVGFPACPGCRAGLQVSRISLTDIQAAGTITIFFTNPPDSAMAWGSHITQNTLDEIFWAGHNSNSQMRVFSWQEGSGTYFWRDVNVSSWARNTLSSTTPDGQNWLAGSGGFPWTSVIGSTRVRNQVWFAWDAGTDQNFRQAHIEMVTLDRNNNFNRLQQVQVWNESYAFGYPYLATNACTQEVGLSFEFGGGGNFENHVVGFWGDFIAYITTGSTVGTTRFGDYVTLRQTPRTPQNPGNLFNAYGYGLNPNPDIHYVVFGRPASTTCRGQ
jgi:hypothetical protein